MNIIGVAQARPLSYLHMTLSRSNYLRNLESSQKSQFPPNQLQRGVYKNLLDAFVRIIQEEGPAELYRGLTSSLIGVVPYAAANYLAYDTLRKAYKKAFKNATFPLEVACEHMQAGALNGRQYGNLLHALVSILEKEGVGGLYRGL
ncbi:hypothetical protein JHK82_036523 [Glycine max]|nr:hypothetical protein JHK82_036523 [Glycine max]